MQFMDGLIEYYSPFHYITTSHEGCLRRMDYFATTIFILLVTALVKKIKADIEKAYRKILLNF